MILTALAAAALLQTAPAGASDCRYIGGPTATGRAWFRGNRRIRVEGREYQKYGLPRTLSPGEVTVFTRHDGVSVAGWGDEREVIYVVVDHATCEFQPYQRYVERRLPG